MVKLLILSLFFLVVGIDILLWRGSKCVLQNHVKCIASYYTSYKVVSSGALHIVLNGDSSDPQIVVIIFSGLEWCVLVLRARTSWSQAMHYLSLAIRATGVLKFPKLRV